MRIYKLVRVLSEDMVMLDSDCGSQIWCMIKLRKDTICYETKIALHKGSFAFRPNTNGYNRMERISVQGMKTLIAIG